MLQAEQLTTLERKIETFAQILKKKPDDELTVLALAEASFRRGLKLEALKAYQEVIRHRPIPEAHLAVAEIYADQNMYAEAYGEIRQLFELDPESVEARLLVSELSSASKPPEALGPIMSRPTSERAFDEARLRLKIQRAIHNRELQERTRNQTLEPGTVIHEYYVEEAKKKLIAVDDQLRKLEQLRENNRLLTEPPRPEPTSGVPAGGQMDLTVTSASEPAQESYHPSFEVESPVAPDLPEDEMAGPEPVGEPTQEQSAQPAALSDPPQSVDPPAEPTPSIEEPVPGQGEPAVEPVQVQSEPNSIEAVAVEAPEPVQPEPIAGGQAPPTLPGGLNISVPALDLPAASVEPQAPEPPSEASVEPEPPPEVGFGDPTDLSAIEDVSLPDLPEPDFLVPEPELPPMAASDEMVAIEPDLPDLPPEPAPMAATVQPAAFAEGPTVSEPPVSPNSEPEPWEAPSPTAASEPLTVSAQEPAAAAVPEAPTPAAPEPAAPAVPEAPTPAAPEPAATAVPEAPTPAAPEPAATAVPEAPTPAAPEPAAAAVPEAPMPATPEPAAPAVPEAPMPAAPEPAAAAVLEPPAPTAEPEPPAPAVPEPAAPTMPEPASPQPSPPEPVATVPAEPVSPEPPPAPAPPAPPEPVAVSPPPPEQPAPPVPVVPIGKAPAQVSEARKAFYVSQKESLTALTATLARTRGVTSIFLVAREGMTIESVAKDTISEERIGDLVQESFEFLEAFAKDPGYWVLECAGGIFVMQKLDQRHVLIAIGQAGANFGALRYTMDKTKTKFEQILGLTPA